MKRLMIIGLWPDDTVNYCTEKCDCRRYAFDRILYHRGGRAARERICIPVVDRSGAVTTYLDLPVTLLEAGVVYLRLDDGSDIFLSNTQMALIANEVERQRAECAGTGLKTLGKWFESGLPTAEDYLEPGADDEDDESLRKRVQEKIAGPAENGNQQHYKTWCESISGVGRARIVPLWAGENTVKGILIDTEGGPASEAVVQRVQEYIDPGGTGLGEGQANIGAHFTATSATAKRVNISFSVTLAKGGDLASVRSAAQTALKAQIKSINLTTDDSETPTLRISTVGNTIYSLLGVLDYANLRFNGQTANVEAGKEEVFVLGEVTVSETNPVS